MQEKKMERAESIRFRERKVKELMVDKKRLVEVPYTATLAHTMNTLVANKVVAVPVAAPPGQWIGAGGSMIVESDKQTGVVRKHYIGMVTMLDIVAHIAGDENSGNLDGGDGMEDLDQWMAVPVSSIIEFPIPCHGVFCALYYCPLSATFFVFISLSATSFFF